MANLTTRVLTKFVKLAQLNDGRLELATTVVGTLKRLQSWPLGRTSLQDRICYAFIFFYCNILLFGLWGHIIILYISADKFSYKAIAFDVGVLTLGTSGYQYCLHLFRHRHLAQKVLQEMGDFRYFEKPPGIELADAVLNAIYKSIIVIILIITPLLLAVLMTASCSENDYSCGFVYPAYFPGLMTSFRRRCLVVVQITSAWMYVLLGTGCVWVGMHMAEYIVSYLKHCQSITKKIALIDHFEERRRHVRFVVQYHQRILFLYKIFQPVAKGVFVVHAISTPVVIAMFMHTFMIDFQVQYFLLFAIWTMTLFVVCLMGQRMINESDTLAEIVFETIPYDGDLVTAKSLFFMLQQTQRSLKIPAGSLTFCEFQLFTNVLKATYSYLALLQRTTNY